jgi:tryptophan synthase alpha chain
LVARLRQFTKLPIAVGFGISNAEHVKAVGEFADAAVIGSALVALIEKTPKAEAANAVGRFIAGLRA